jgi:ankyrin repeat protein
MRQFGNDLLLHCAERGYTGAVRELLKYSKEGGVDINVSNPDENTPLHLAVKHGWDDIVAFLLKSGAEMLVINKKGLMPADYIDIKENKKLVRIFNNYERMWVSRILQSVGGAHNPNAPS